MSKTYTTLKSLLGSVLVCLFSVVAPVSCIDDFEVADCGTGDGSIAMTVSYYPNVTNEVQTRAAGNAMEDLRSLAVVVYTDAGQFVDLLDETRLPGLDKTLTHTDRPEMSEEDTKNKGGWTEGEQKRATFRLEGLPFGRYKIYCVANMAVTPDMVKLSEGEKTYETDEDKLRSCSLAWNPNNIAANDAMFGYFTEFDEKNIDAPLGRNYAGVVEINRTDIKLHAWLKRAASKVTVAFDGSGLRQNVSIFIHKVTIKDIPRTCFLGKDNTPVAKELKDRDAVLIEDGETIYYGINGETDTNPGDGEAKHTSWMQIDNGHPYGGSKHEANSKALFFFENMQGDYEDKPADWDDEKPFNKESYNKEPKAGWVHEYLKRPDADWDKTPWDYDTKDKILAGTYIEVEGYYESTNDLNTTKGPIKYRFMLGKNTTYNYNAQRNHHYKVTLKFKGWANQPEWHIEYIEEKPDLDVVDYLYMPYNYRERTTLPIRFIGDLQTLDVEILENDWAPYHYDDSLKTIKLATYVRPTSDASLNENDSQQNTFMWNKPAWDIRNGINSDLNPVTVSGGKKMQYLGFLALTMPLEPPATVLDDMAYGLGIPALLALKAIYNNGDTEKGWLSQTKRKFVAANLTPGEHPTADEEPAKDQSDEYTVYKDGNATTVLMPVFTRAKSMIATSGYTGNNPYEFHSRVAKLMVTAKFYLKNKDKDTTLVRYVRVVQRPRITNPKAVWKSIGTEHSEFKVTVMTRSGEDNNADYKPFKSNGSWTAEVEVDPDNNFTLIAGPNCVADEEKPQTKLIGKTNTEMVFTIKFGGKAACGIINVKYHAEKCTHRIFVRQGDDPIQVNEGGATWLSKNLLHGGDGTYESESDELSTGATLVDDPVSFGSYFKRGQLNQGIEESNNKTHPHLAGINPNSDEPLLTLSNGTSAKWYLIPHVRLPDADSQASPNSMAETDADKYVWQNIQLKGSTTTYSLPTYDDFQHLTSNSEFGFGILYGDEATETKTKFDEATGYAAMWEDGTSAYGMRAVVVYNKSNGNQVYFPLSASGDGRRNQAFKNYNNKTLAGRLLYGDTDYRLTNTKNGNNQFRPIPYNLPYSNGAIYWIKQINSTGHVEGDGKYPCAAWDINYFNFDFGPYTANCLTLSPYWENNVNLSLRGWALGSDALPIRLVQKHVGE